MTSQELKKKFISFMESKGHKHIPNSSLIPENDPSALFINSGMHPIVPFLLGNPHPLGKRLTNYQRAVRTGDIEEVGDNRHMTFFEMLGEWSLGDYGKKESLEWSFEFLVEILGWDPQRIHPSVYRGNRQVPRDEEAIQIWKNIFRRYGIEADVADKFDDSGKSARIIALGDDDNFWPKGVTSGPCGPTSEIYYDRGFGETWEDRYLEICNNVFMSYLMTSDGQLQELPVKNIDVGWGFERLLSIIQSMQENGDVPLNVSVYDTDLFELPKMVLIGELKVQNVKIAGIQYESNDDFRQAIRIMLDHIRAAVMIIADGIEPSNKDQGYVLRRLIRRAVTFNKKYSDNFDNITLLAEMFIEQLSRDKDYKFLRKNKRKIIDTLSAEREKFLKVLENGIKELKKIEEHEISAQVAFRLKEALGLPLEITQVIASQQGRKVDIEGYEKLMEVHQEKSRTATKGKFIGGLGDFSPESVRYHTCAHLFLAGARKFLGDSVHQKGQNITSERLRYDISYPKPITHEQINAIERWVNEQIDKNLTVDFIEVSLEEAQALGAEGVFSEKYEKLRMVKVYRIHDKNSQGFISLELCGGPHVSNTEEIKEQGKFKIQKEESSGQGVRRIKAILAK